MPDRAGEHQGVEWKALNGFLIAMAVLGLASSNALLTTASFLVLLMVVKLLRRPGEPPVLLFAMTYHWMQACVLTLSADLQGKRLDQMDVSQAVIPAAWLTLLGVLVVTLGIRVVVGRSSLSNAQKSVDALATKLSVRKLFQASILAIIFAELLTVISVFIPGLRQPILAFTTLHWVVVFIFTYTVLHQRNGFGLLIFLTLIEIIIGMLGYFSGFRNILILLLLAVLTTPRALRGMRFPVAIAAIISVVSLALVWTAIKKEYRSFLNMGTGNQVVLVSREDRLKKLSELIADVTPEKLSESISTLADRMTYVHFFGESIKVVPDIIPHENGLLWREAIENALVPRAFYPGKKVLNDSERTSYYTGGFVSGYQEGTSISLGYMAESYIDFGPFFMFLPIFLWGLFCGYVYITIIKANSHRLFGYSSATVLIFLNATLLEASNVKMVGGMALGFIALYIFSRYYSSSLAQQLSSPDWKARIKHKKILHSTEFRDI